MSIALYNDEDDDKGDDNTWLVHSSPPTLHSCLHGESQEGGWPERQEIN